ncbi:hypothetical protein V8G54_027500 [Vigna mungo]|uniref:Uncharacterized protein n=1 Tax=Vigna mungo TaxID=3915 RepID=A0AAQ3N2Y8_VIGMU
MSIDTSLSSTQTLNPFRIMRTALQSSNVRRTPRRLVKYTTIRSSVPDNRNGVVVVVVVHDSQCAFDSDWNSDSGAFFEEDSNKVQSFLTIFPRIEVFADSADP